jgi:hypothetical protein
MGLVGPICLWAPNLSTFLLYGSYAPDRRHFECDLFGVANLL